MIVVMENTVYDMSVEMFDSIISTVTSINSSRYFIYCVVSSDKFILVNEIFENKDEFVSCLLSYVDKGFDVYFVEEGERYVEHHL